MSGEADNRLSRNIAATTISVTKSDAARCEIEAAIAVFALQRNYLAAELVAHAAIDVIDGVAKHHNVMTLTRTFYETYIKDEYLKAAKRHIKAPYNFFKHSDRDAGTALDKFDPEVSSWRIFTAIADFHACFGERTWLMTAFLCWFWSRNPDVAGESVLSAVATFNESKGDMSKLQLNEAIDSLRNFYLFYLNNEENVRTSKLFRQLNTA